MHTAPDMKTAIKMQGDLVPEEIKHLILEEDDFGHEMRVSHIFDTAPSRPAGNNTHFEALEHGWSYQDSSTGKSRQLDFRFRITCSMVDSKASLFLAVECKNLHKSSPLIVCGRSRTREESYYHFVHTSADAAGGHWAHTKIARSESLYKQGEFVGKNLVRLKKKSGKTEVCNDSDVYEKWSQAEASAVGMIQSAHTMTKCRSLILPVVVIPDGSMWKVTYNGAGEILEVTAADECEYFVGKRIPSSPKPFDITHVHIVTLKGFAKLIGRFAELPDFHNWEGLYFPLASKVAG